MGEFLYQVKGMNIDRVIGVCALSPIVNYDDRCGEFGSDYILPISLPGTLLKVPI